MNTPPDSPEDAAPDAAPIENAHGDESLAKNDDLEPRERFVL